MEIKDLTNNFEELTVFETSKVVGGNKIIKSIKKIKKEKGAKFFDSGETQASCDPIDWITFPPDYIPSP